MTSRAARHAAFASVALLWVVVGGCASPPMAPTASATPHDPRVATPTSTPPPVSTTPSGPGTDTPAVAARYQDAAYEIEGRTVRLTNGLSEIEAAPGSASKIVTRIFGNEAGGDLNGDGVADMGFVLTQSGGGSGTFYYAAAALQTRRGWIGTNAVLLGDRIAPQSTQLQGGVLIVNYAERRPGEPMTARASIGVSKYLKVVNGRLVATDQPR